jgi:hypothetical protein
MAASLGHFLLGLAADPDAAVAFSSSVETARAIMSAAGLSDEQQAAVLSNDPAIIADAIHAELTAPEAAAGRPVTITFNIFGPPRP